MDAGVWQWGAVSHTVQSMVIRTRPGESRILQGWLASLLENEEIVGAFVAGRQILQRAPTRTHKPGAAPYTTRSKYCRLLFKRIATPVRSFVDFSSGPCPRDVPNLINGGLFLHEAAPVASHPLLLPLLNLALQLQRTVRSGLFFMNCHLGQLFVVFFCFAHVQIVCRGAENEVTACCQGRRQRPGRHLGNEESIVLCTPLLLQAR